MHKQVNHIKLDEAIKAALNSNKVYGDRMPFEQLKPYAQKKSSKQPFKQFAFSLNSFAGSFSLTTFINKQALFIFIKKWAVAMYFIAGTAIVGTGGIYMYNNVSFSHNTQTVHTTVTKHVNSGRSSLVDALLGNIFQLVKNTPNILRSVSTVTGQVSDPPRYVAVTPIQSNVLQQGIAGSVTTDNTEVTAVGENAEPIQLTTTDAADQNQTYDFSNTGNLITEQNAKDQLLSPENTPALDPSAEGRANKNKDVSELRAKEDNVPVKKKDTKSSKSTKKKKVRFFSKEALKH